MGGAPSHILGETLIQGGADVVNNPDWFKKKEVTHVVSICEATPRHELKGKIHLDVDDMMTTDLYQHFEETTNFIHKARGEGGRVYVHCAAGTDVHPPPPAPYCPLPRD
jgi:protein-tyrosine phosphatase